jgi:hypothetical protein
MTDEGLTELVVEVEEPQGPGIDVESDDHGRPVGRRARTGGIWLGFDRGGAVETDDGRGRRLPVVVAVPTSTYRGCRLVAHLVGAWQLSDGVILVATIAGWNPPAPPLALAAAGQRETGTWLSAEAAGQVLTEARHRYRRRRSEARETGGRAWQAVGLPPELARYATPHSEAEYSLARLPPRFVRGFEGLLEDDERLLYWVERPQTLTVGLVDRLRRRIDPRAALLALTDRQLVWLVDHARPDRYLSDWGTDVEVVPVERMREVSVRVVDDQVELAIGTPAGPRSYRLPVERASEVEVMAAFLRRFVGPTAGGPPRRTYTAEALAFDPEPASRFGQADVARRLYEDAQREGEVLAFLFSPSRPGQERAAALVLRRDRLERREPEGRQAVPLSDLAALRLVLSPLVGEAGGVPGGPVLRYPAPLAQEGAALVRLARRVLAMV